MQKRVMKNFLIIFTVIFALAGTSQPIQANDLINVNTATRDQLVTIKGIGKKTAARIIEYREDNGGFTSIEDLIFIKGIGTKKMEKFRKVLSVSDDDDE